MIATRRFSMFFALCALLLFACGASAAPVVTQPTFYEVRAVPPDGYDGALSLHFEMSQNACLKAYGSGWQKVCTASPKPEGAPADLKISPAVRGNWTWEGNSTLVFTPEKPWQPQKSYTVSLGKNSTSGEIRLKSAAVKFSTPPLAARIDSRNVWIDPGPEGKHGLSFSVSFNYPAPAVPDGQLFSLEALAPARGLELERTEYVWNREARTSVSISSPIKKLGDEAGIVAVTVNGLPSIVRKPDGEIFYAENFQERMRVPGKKGFLKLTGADLVLDFNDAMRQEYHLVLGFNAMMKVSDVLKKISVVQLPAARTPEALEPYVWSKAPYIGPEDIEKATPLKVEAVSNAEDISSKVILRIAPAPGSYVAAIVPDNLLSPAGLSLAQSEIKALPASSLKKSLSFLQSGNVLALSSDKKITLLAHELDHIRWTAYQVRPEFISLAASQNSSLSGLLETESKLAVATSGRCDLPAPRDGRPQFATLDLSPLLADGKKGIMELQATGVARKDDGTLYDELTTRRFVLLTDLGLVVKNASRGERVIFVCSLSEGRAVDGAEIEVLGANGLPVFKTASGNGGRAHIPNLSGLTPDKQATVIVVRKGDDLAYLPLGESDLALNYDKFETGGRVGLGQDSLIAHVFSQRGMFRPGETLHFGMVIRKADWGGLPDSVPLLAALWDPTGKKLAEKNISTPKDGLCEFSWHLTESSVTGVYRLDVRIPGPSGAVIGSRAVRVEEFQPDTLSIKTTFKPGHKKGWIKADTLRAEISLLNMTGLPAQNRKVSGKMAVSANTLRFGTYAEYSFYQGGGRDARSTERVLPEKRTDDGGKAEFDINLGEFAKEVMTVDLTFEGFEPGGGRSVQTASKVRVSQLDYVVGVKTSANLRFLHQGGTAVLNLVALNPDLEAIDPGVLNVITAKRRYISSLVNDKGQFRHETAPQDTEIARHNLQFAKGEDNSAAATFALFTGEPGDYVATFYDKQGRAVSAVTYSVAGKSLHVQNDLEAGKLNLRLEKDEYDSGDTIQLALAVPFDGMGLLTIERDTVLAHTWFRAEAGECVQDIVIPKDFVGKGYVNVSFARSLSSPDIYTLPLAFAVAPFTANIKTHDLGLKLESESLIKPGRNLSVTVKSKEKGKAVIFAVDEGVLQLTDFTTPSPLHDLLADRGLDVRTSQNLGLLMPDNRLLQGMLPAFGGGLGSAGGKFLNPFKRRNEPPVAYWSSIIDVSPEGARVDVPIAGYYNGKVRLMAVGSSEGLTGSAEAEATVRDDIILTPQFPVIAAPGDRFEAGVSVANNLPAGGNGAKITLTFECEGSISIDGPQEAEITLAGGNEDMVRFNARIGGEPGQASVRLTAKAVSGGTEYRTVRESTLSVRPASPRMSSLRAGQTLDSLRLKTGRKLFAHDAVSQASVSSLPLPLVNSLVRYLEGYPYGCTEQLISRAFPYVLLLSRPELLSGSGEPAKDIRRRGEKIIHNAVAAIQASFKSDQGIALWEGMQPDLLLTAYAADFLLEARAAGFGAPVFFENQILDALETQVVSSSTSMTEARAKAYGIWTLTRSGRIAADSLAALVKFLDNDAPGRKEDVTSSLLAGSLSLLKIGDADTLIRDFRADAAQFTHDEFFDSLAAASLHIAVLARHFPDLLDANIQEDTISDLLRVTVNALRAGNYASFSAAQSIRAIMALADRQKPASGEVKLTCVSPEIAQSRATTDLLFSVDAPGCEEFSLDLPPGDSTWFWQVYTEGYDRFPPDEAVSKGLEISVAYTDADGRAVDEVSLGSEITVRVTANVFDKKLDNVAMTVLLPGGFEMVLPRDDGNSRQEANEDDGEGKSTAVRSTAGEEWPSTVNHIDRREDRMLIFTTLTREKQTFAYRVKAVNKGTFTLPPACAEGMYSRNIRGNSAAGVIRVK